MMTHRLFPAVLAISIGVLWSVRLGAQEGIRAVPAGAPAGVPAQPAQPPVGPDGKPAVGPDGKPVQPGQPGGAPADAAKPEAPKAQPRPAKPDVPPNPDELKVRPDAEGKVQFNFQGQPWLDVLEWLAKISNLSLDWQEVPIDFLNLRTQRSYTVDEARDLINRHLLDRGFTLLKHGEVLSVVNIKKLDPSLVPRVSPDALDERQPHEFVKVSFPLESLTAEAATEELKPMLSPNHKISALKATNRIEVLDAVANLREVREVLAHEQTQKGRKRLVQQFPLQYVRASEVLEQLQELLGIEKKKPAAPMTPQQMQQQMMMEQQIAQQQAQRGGQPGGQQKQAPAVHMVVNPKENAVVVTAPADQMAIIAEAVKIIDVPSSRSQSLLKNMNRMQIYRLASIDPEAIVKMLQEIGDLDPTTNLQVDKKNRAIIAEASLADHMTIRMLVKKLDGTDRQFEVIKLRRLEADYVAGSIEFMMGGGDKKKNQNNNRGYYYYDPWGYGGGRNTEEDESRKFRVDADVEHNRLLLWANPVELEEVNHLLVKLGEIPPEGGNLSQLRVLDSIAPEEVEQLLERLKRTWPGVGPNPLQIAPPPATDPEDAPAAAVPPKKKPARARTRSEETTTGARPPREARETALVDAKLLRLVQVAAEDEAGETEGTDDGAAEPGGEAVDKKPPATPDLAEGAVPEEDGLEESPVREPRRPAARPGELKMAAPPPIRIGRGADGRMIISSTDTVALDRLEDLLTEIAPPRKDYEIFKMKYKSTWAYGVALNLKDFFDDKEKAEPKSRWDYIYGYYPSSSSSKGDETRRLSKRRPLKFIADSDSNSILVTGADPAQLKIIRDLIDIYDVPESKDSAAVRQTKIVSLRYSKARVVADAVKDVYRDLLSANDPALQNQKDDKKNKPPDAMYTYITNLGGDEKKPETPMKFKGLLSIGVDELSNTLVVSAAESLLENVTLTIQALDDAARPMVGRMQVMKVDRNIDVGDLQKRLKNLMPKPPQQPPKQPQPGQPQNQNQQPPPDSAVFIENN
jgi:type II secretory pathway component GspD/PulD (secretin)